MNTKLLKKIRAEILKRPLRLDMADWVNAVDDLAPCGTTACIAGFAVLLNKQRAAKVAWRKAGELLTAYNYSRSDISATAADFLRLGYGQQNRLFHSLMWPIQFFGPWVSANNKFNALWRDTTPGVMRKRKALRLKMAKITARRITHFIKTKGEE